MGFPSLTGNGKWICMHECYVCQRWQAICFLYQPVTDQSSFVEDKKKTWLKEKYKLSGSFETLMMHYGGR